MLATLLLLAQLVLPWPRLDSPLVQPGPTICVGECAGPVVWGPAERGRLVVACDMRSDTCSDGRRITTVRASPVPCEVSPGVWEMVGVDEGCYGVRGLESWAATTTYLSYGAELDRSPWGGVATATKVGSTYRVCADEPGNFRQQLASESGGQVRTAACRVRAGTSNSIRLLAADVSSGGVNFDYTLTDAWQTVTATATVVEGGGVAGVRLHPARSGAGCVEVAGCWSVRGTTPGRACWGGEAPVTCAADSHTISTEGWPTDGEICITADIGNVADSMLLDSRFGGGNTFVRFLSGRLRLNDAVGAQVVPGTHRVCVRMEGGLVSATLNGEPAVPEHALAVDWGTATYLGRSTAGTRIDGSIRSLTVRSYEEVSP